MNTPIYLATDAYKLNHRRQYPENTTKVYSTWTPRADKFAPWLKNKQVVVFGLQYFIKEYLMKRFSEDLFEQPKSNIRKNFEAVLPHYLAATPAEVDEQVAAWEALYDLGYVPLEIHAIPEGELSDIRVPIFAFWNTHPDFFWLTNFLETIMSTTLWEPLTSASLAYNFRNMLDNYALKTTGSTEGVAFQGHDFSMRGMSSEQSAASSGAGHLLSFLGSDSVGAGFFLNKYYDAPWEGLMGSISATEHSVMCSYGQTGELELLRHLLNDVYPTGFFSAVCDTWDYFKLVTEYLPTVKEDIMNRDGRFVVRPDSGNPVDIICGTNQKFGEGNTPEEKGSIELLWEIFGGSINEQGYKVLDPHIGLIYGDGITYERAEQISERLMKKGFATTNVVYGIGSYTYQMNSRDTLGQAVKATYAVVNGEERLLFKDPKTDDGTKRSQRGMVVVTRDEDGHTHFEDGFTDSTFTENVSIMKPVFKNGMLLKNFTLEEIREKLAK